MFPFEREYASTFQMNNNQHGRGVYANEWALLILPHFKKIKEKMMEKNGKKVKLACRVQTRYSEKEKGFVFISSVRCSLRALKNVIESNENSIMTSCIASVRDTRMGQDRNPSDWWVADEARKTFLIKNKWYGIQLSIDFDEGVLHDEVS